MYVDDTERGGHKRVSIDQHSEWCWKDKENGLLTHLPDGDAYKLDGNTLQKVASDGSV